MASDIAVRELGALPHGAIVLDPMTGSGTVLRRASEMGFNAIGFDMDPLAVLMSRVWTTPVTDESIAELGSRIVKKARSLKHVNLPWIDEDLETKSFVSYWFGKKQRSALRRIAYVLNKHSKSRSTRSETAALDVIKLALSRIIVTKERGASLARDTSHSRPHRVAISSDFDVLLSFERSLSQVRKLLKEAPPPGNVKVTLGDARQLKKQPNESVDGILTSPPYLNAIDYMRGHKMSLVWLGFNLQDLRSIRSSSIGAERSLPDGEDSLEFDKIQDAMCNIRKLSRRHANMVARYSRDLYLLLSETHRVLKTGGTAIFVVGNSCLKGTFISNADGVTQAADMVGLSLKWSKERALPNSNRYLPMPKGTRNPLGKRMRTETILSFARN
jgi:hypothetical protein